MDYVVAVPSYKRVDICRDQTLALLERLKVDKEKIYIFVADEEEFFAYNRDKVIRQYIS